MFLLEKGRKPGRKINPEIVGKWDIRLNIRANTLLSAFGLIFSFKTTKDLATKCLHSGLARNPDIQRHGVPNTGIAEIRRRVLRPGRDLVGRARI